MDFQIILSVVNHFLLNALLVSSLLLWLQRRVNMKPRICLMSFLLLSFGFIAYGLYGSYTGMPHVSGVLSPVVLTGGVLELLLLYLYPIAVINSKSITLTNVLLLFMPWLIICAIQIALPIDFIYLSSFSEMLEHVGEFNVWFRWLILFVCIIPYTIVILLIPYKWQQSHVDRMWIYKYTLAVLCLGVLFCVSTLSGSQLMKTVHFLYGAVFCIYITYQELFVRIFPASEDAEIIGDIDEHMPVVVLPEAEQDVVLNPLWVTLTTMMEEQELWREPDLNLDDLAKRLFTNRTTLSALIQQRGYSSYTEFINCQRIDAFVEKVKCSHSINIQEMFYNVGFRSKSAALRNFRLYMNCTPSEYIQRIVMRK